MQADVSNTQYYESLTREFELEDSCGLYSFSNNIHWTSNIKSSKKAELRKLKENAIAAIKKQQQVIQDEITFDQGKISRYIINIINQFGLYHISKFNASLTASDSIYFTLCFENENRYKIEIFFDSIESFETCDEVVLHVYENETKLHTYFGNINDIYTIIHKNQARKPSKSTYYPFQESTQTAIPSIFGTETFLQST